MLSKLLALLFSTTAFAQTTLRTTDFQQSLNANAPRNYALSGSAEKNTGEGTSDNIDSSGIMTRTTTAPLEGVGSFSINATTSGQAVFFGVAGVQPGLFGQACETKFTYLGDGTLYKAYMSDGSDAISDEVTLINSGSNAQQVNIVYSCSSSLTFLAIEATDNAAAAVKFDSIYSGSALSLGSVVQAYHFGSLTYAATANCVWTNTSVGTPATLAADADCPTPTVTGRVKAPATKIVAFLVPAGTESGVIDINATGEFGSSRTGDTTSIRVAAYDGTTLYNEQQFTGTPITNFSFGTPGVRFSVPYTTQSTDKTIEIRISSSNSSPTNRIDARTVPLTFNVKMFPTSEQLVLRGNVTNVMVTANGLPTGPRDGSGSTIWGTEVRDTTGSYNNTTGAFTAPTSGDYCWSARVGVSGTGAANSRTLIDPYVDGTILGRGTGIIRYEAASTGQYDALSVYCTFLNQGQVLTFRTSSNITTPIFSEANAGVNSLTIWNESQAGAKPYTPGSEFNQYTGTTNAIYAEINCDAASSITSQSGGLSIGNRSTTSCALTMAAGVFSATPWYCNLTIKSSTVQATSCSCSSATSCTVYGPSADYDGYVQLKGAK